MYLECSRFHPNRFNFGGFIAERVITAKTRRKWIHIQRVQHSLACVLTQAPRRSSEYLVGNKRWRNVTRPIRTVQEFKGSDDDRDEWGIHLTQDWTGHKLLRLEVDQHAGQSATWGTDHRQSEPTRRTVSYIRHRPSTEWTNIPDSQLHKAQTIDRVDQHAGQSAT